jgi:ankyrin repeat protein
MTSKRLIAFLLLAMTFVLVSCGKQNPEAKLHRAAQFGRLEEMRELIDSGEDVNKKVDGRTPLHYAAKGRNLESLAFLLENGADPMVVDDQDRDAWDLVYDERKSYLPARDAAVLAFLLNNGYQSRLTLLEAAEEADSAVLIKALVDGGQEVSQTDEFGWTPLHWAAFKANGESCLALLQANADPNAESTKEYAKTISGGDGESRRDRWRYEAGSRPLDVARYGTVRGGRSTPSILKEWGATENPDVDNKKKPTR